MSTRAVRLELKEVSMRYQFASKTKQPTQHKSSPSPGRTGVSLAPPRPVLQLQRTIGNQGVLRLLESQRIQPKCACGGSCPRCQQANLKMSHPGDKYEQEADRVADQVMRMPASGVQRQKEGGSGPAQSPTQDRPTTNTSGGSGQPLPDSVRSYFEPRFRHDFSKVRVHTDRRAAASAREISARAYTVGADIVFGKSQYASENTEGRRLLAHELTHVVQQTGGAPMLQRQPACAAPAGRDVSNDVRKNAHGEFGWCVFENAGSNGVDAHIEFDEDAAKTDCDSLNWIQNVRNYRGATKTTFYLNSDVGYYSAFDIGTGTYLDHSKSVGETNPLYNTAPGALTDRPALRSIAGERGQTFETAPFCAKGKDEGRFYGSIGWGWDEDGAGNFSLQAPAVRDDLLLEVPMRAPNMFQTLDKFLGVKAQAGFNRMFVEFAFDSATLDATAKTELDKVAKRLTDNPDEQAWLIGHADAVGTDDYNLDLSLRRSKAAEDYLVGKGIGRDRLFITGLGETIPKVVTENKKRENRRVEIFVIDPARGFAL